MKSVELKNLWNAYDKSLDQMITTNTKALKKLTMKKIKHKLRPVYISRIIDLTLALVVVGLLGSYISFCAHIPFLWGNGLIVFFFAIAAVISSVEQIILIRQVQYTAPIIIIRKKIEQVNKHQWFYTKLFFLLIGFWFAIVPTIIGVFFFVLSTIYEVDILSNVVNKFSTFIEPEFNDYIRLNIIINLLLLIPLGWLFIKLSYKNIHVKWVRKTIHFFMSTKTKAALAFLTEIERFEKEEII